MVVCVCFQRHIFQKWKLSGSTQQRAVKVLCVQHLFYLHDILWPLPKNLYVYCLNRIVYIFIVAMDLSFTFFGNPIFIYDIFIWIVFDSEISLALLSLCVYFGRLLFQVLVFASVKNEKVITEISTYIEIVFDELTSEQCHHHSYRIVWIEPQKIHKIETIKAKPTTLRARICAQEIQFRGKNFLNQMP